jgi:hypothetical protein
VELHSPARKTGFRILNKAVQEFSESDFSVEIILDDLTLLYKSGFLKLKVFAKQESVERAIVMRSGNAYLIE